MAPIYRPFINDPKHISQLAGQQFVVLRAHTMRPLQLECARLNVFPHPFQIVVLELTKTAELIHAMTSLRTLTRQRNLVVETAIPVDRWVFHCSLAYCAAWDERAWEDIGRMVAEIDLAAGTRCEASEAELVAFEGGSEQHAGSFAFGAG